MTAKRTNACGFVPAVILMVVFLAGCATSSPAPVLLTLPTAWFATTPPVMPVGAAAAPAPAPLLVVRRIGLPEYVVARRVRYRTDDATLAEWPNTYWAERIEIGVSREFASALRRRLAGWSVCEAPCLDQSPRSGLQVDVMTMDYVRAERRLRGRARVSVTAGSGSATVLQQESDYEIVAGADSAQAQAQAIADLVGQIAAASASLVQRAGI